MKAATKGNTKVKKEKPENAKTSRKKPRKKMRPKLPTRSLPRQHSVFTMRIAQPKAKKQVTRKEPTKRLRIETAFDEEVQNIEADKDSFKGFDDKLPRL